MADKMKSINWKDVAARTIKTFVASFFGGLAIDALYGITDAKGLAKAAVATLFSAASAGITAVWNMLLEMYRDKFNAWIDRIIDNVFKSENIELTQEQEETEEPDPDAGEDPDGWIC